MYPSIPCSLAVGAGQHTGHRQLAAPAQCRYNKESLVTHSASSVRQCCAVYHVPCTAQSTACNCLIFSQVLAEVTFLLIVLLMQILLAQRANLLFTLLPVVWQYTDIPEKGIQSIPCCSSLHIVFVLEIRIAIPKSNSSSSSSTK